MARHSILAQIEFFKISVSDSDVTAFPGRDCDWIGTRSGRYPAHASKKTPILSTSLHIEDVAATNHAGSASLDREDMLLIGSFGNDGIFR